ncbi:MAG: hypothetical protein ABW162_15925 [Candidatus Sedimenticola sp. PURPLELP]
MELLIFAMIGWNALVLIMHVNFVRKWTLIAGAVGAFIGSSVGIASDGNATSGILFLALVCSTIASLFAINVYKDRKRAGKLTHEELDQENR